VICVKNVTFSAAKLCGLNSGLLVYLALAVVIGKETGNTRISDQQGSGKGAWMKAMGSGK